MKDKTTQLKGKGHHPGDEEFLCFLDGELAPRKSEDVRSHLEACWSCRARTEKFQNAINSFVDYRHLVLTPSLKRPEKRNNFQGKLQEAKFHQEPTKGFFGRWLEIFNTGFKFSPPVYVKFGIPFIAVILVIALFLNQLTIQTVSAAELLQNTAEAQKTSLSKSTNPVIYQKILVRRTKNNTVGESVNWETWKDTVGNNYRDAVEKEGIRQLIVDKFANEPTKVPHILEEQRPVLLTELAKVLQLNHLNPKDPLSAASFASWRDSLPQKNEVVSKTVTENNEKSFELKVTPFGELGNGQIVGANYLVRANDWTPLKLKLEVKENDEIVTFELVRQSSEVIAFSQLSPEIFPKIQVTTIPNSSITPKESSSPTASPETEIAKNENTNSNLVQITPTEKAPKNQGATADLEVEVLQLLNNAKADLGEQITVQRGSDGLLYVRGIVETPNRKIEILQYLQNIQNNPAIRIEIKTVDEAVAEQKTTPNPSGTAEKVESQGSETAVDSELLKYFKTEQEATAFSGQIIARSRRVMSRAYALKRLSEQFKPEELRQLSPEAKTKLLNLISSHARAFREESEGLRRDLQPVFNAPNVGASITIDISNIGDLPRAVAVLLDFASANNRVVQSRLYHFIRQRQVLSNKNHAVLAIAGKC